MPISWWHWKITHYCFCFVWKLLMADFVIDHPLGTLLMLTRTENSHWLLHWCCRDFQSDNHCRFNIFPPLSAERKNNFLQLFLNSPLSGVEVLHYCIPPFNCMRVPSSFLLSATICVTEFYCKTYTIFWPWMTIPKDQSMNNCSSICVIVFVCFIAFMNDMTFHNGDKDGDKNTDLPDDWFFDNEGILVWLQLQFVHMFVCLQLSHDLLMLFDQEILQWWTWSD